MNFSIRGIQEAQRGNLNMIRTLQPGGAITDALRDGAIQAHRYAVSITHVWPIMGGALRASHRIDYEQYTQFRVHIDPMAVSPRGGKPIDYGPAEHARGGPHSFYARVESERGGEIGRSMGARLVAWWR